MEIKTYSDLKEAQHVWEEVNEKVDFAERSDEKVNIIIETDDENDYYLAELSDDHNTATVFHWTGTVERGGQSVRCEKMNGLHHLRRHLFEIMMADGYVIRTEPA